MICPTCNGDKTLMAIFPMPMEIDCPRCSGSGEIPDEQKPWIEKGDVMLKLRLKFGFGLRHAAEVLGVLPSDLAAAEHGRINPDAMFERVMELQTVER